ncbi:MAG: transglutaminase domain-containing protein [Gammaproteobacteria bacterium]
MPTATRIPIAHLKKEGRSMMTAPLLTRIRETPAFLRPTAATVLIAFLMLILEPLAVAAQNNNPPAPAKAAAGDDRLFADTVQKIAAQLERLHDKLEKHQDGGAERSALKQLQRTLQQLDGEEQQSFAAIEQHLKEHNLPAEIFERQRAMLDNYQSEYDALMTALDAIAQADNDADRLSHAQTALQRLKAKQYKPAHQPFDPKNLPFQVPDGKVRAPKETPEELQQLIQAQAPVQVAALELNAGMLAQATTQTTSAPQAADLAPTEDVQITDDIKALAQSLNNDPVAIYNWVRNNIEYIPTYGSIQGSQLTLTNQKGNAFDTASLLIALYRAAGIPARYVYGTVQIPIEQVMNWVGGMSNPMAALELMGQGGIPNIALTQGGVVKYGKIEHVWVEAYVDFIPSRGAKHKSGDTWVALDASFKQYDFTKGMDIKTAVPLDIQDLLDQIQAGATLNEAEGWVQNINSPVLQTALTDYQSRVQAYIDGQKPNATMDDMLGDKKIVEQKFPILPGSLPYHTVVTSSEFAQIPDSLRWKIKLNLYGSELDKVTQSPQFSVALNLSKLGISRLAATYVPASEADAQVIQSYATTNRLPVYLVNEVLRIQIDDTVLGEYHAQTMGAPQYWTYTLTKPGGNAIEEDFKLVSSVGDQIVFGINGAGTSLNQISARYHSIDPNSSLENLNHLAMGYWARVDLSDAMIANQFETVVYRLPSVGMFAQPLSIVYSWGVPWFGSYKSYSIDVRRLISSAVTVDGKIAANFRFQSGLGASQLEGRIFEEIFDLARGNGFSAVAVIATAIRNGVPIWKVDSINLQSFLAASILSSEVKNQISNAVSAGLLVITPEEGIDVGFWSGQGYIAVDPKTGAGGYILNSANGGEFAACEEKPVPLTESIQEQVLTYIALGLVAILIATGEIGSGGLATPAIVLAMTTVGISSLTWSTTSYAAGKCKSNEKCHRGSIQAQGRDIAGPGKGNSRTKSAPWAQPTPLTLAQGLAKSKELKLQLTPAELSARLVYFELAEAYMRTVSLSGGVCAGPPKSFGPSPTIKDHVAKGIRVDINVNAGEAFVP